MSAADTVTALYPQFLEDALDADYDDFDAASLKNGAARAITQAVSAHLYLQKGVDGLQFGPRHDDELNLGCLYEQPHDSRISAHLLKLEAFDLTPDTPQLQQTLEMPGRRWASTAQTQTTWVRHRPEETSRNRCENSRDSVASNRPYVKQ